MVNRSLLPPLSELLAFESAARHGSFTRAAQELCLTQGAISRSVRLLEERLSVALFERIRQRVVLTGTGSSYLQQIQPLLDELGNATRRAMALAPSEEPLNLAVLPTFAQRWLIPRLPAFTALHPQVTINCTTRLVPFDFAREPFDAAIHHGRDVWAGATTHLLMDEVMVPMCAPSYRAALDLRTPEDFARATLLHQSTRPTAWSQWFEQAGVANDHAYRGPSYDQFGMIAQAAAAGMGLALLPQFLVEQELEIGRLEILSRIMLRLGSGYYLVLPQNGMTTGAELLKDWITGLVND